MTYQDGCHLKTWQKPFQFNKVMEKSVEHEQIGTVIVDNSFKKFGFSR